MTPIKLTPRVLAEWLVYDPISGGIRWRKHASTSARAGQIAGSINVDGYRVLHVRGNFVYGHHAAFALMSGRLGVRVDHRNTNRSDNRWDNLREATQRENVRNRRGNRNRSGLKGAYRTKCGTYYSRIEVDGVRIYLGSFSTEEQAHAAYCAAAAEHFGEFARYA